MSHLWVEPLSFEDPVLGVHHLIRGTGHALIFLCEKWRWHEGGAYHDAIEICSTVFEQRLNPAEARDALMAALVGAGLLDADCLDDAPRRQRAHRS